MSLPVFIVFVVVLVGIFILICGDLPFVIMVFVKLIFIRLFAIDSIAVSLDAAVFAFV